MNTNIQKPRTIQEMMRRIEDLEAENKRLMKGSQNRAYVATERLKKIRAFVNKNHITNPTIRAINEILNEK